MPAHATKLPKLAFAEDLDPLIVMALNALPAPSDSDRDSLSAGDHPVDLVLHVAIKGTLAVGPSTSTVQINKLKPWHLARLLANKVSAADLQDCINTAIAAAHGSAASEAMEAESDDLKARVEAAFDQAGLSVKQPRRGTVRLLGTLTVEER